MKQYNVEELHMLNQLLLGIFLVADFSFYLLLSTSVFPWYSLIGAAIGLVIIVFSWSGAKYYLFNSTILICALLFSLAYNWSAIFNLH